MNPEPATHHHSGTRALEEQSSKAWLLGNHIAAKGRSYRTMNMNALYPVVVDLSDSEYAPQGFCCSQFLCSGGVEFSLNDLVSPEQMPITYEDDRRELVRSQSSAMRRSRSQGLSLASTPLTQAQFETRNEYDEAVFDHRRMTFNDLYVLTRLVRLCKLYLFRHIAHC